MTRSFILVWADPETGEVMNLDGTSSSVIVPKQPVAWMRSPVFGRDLSLTRNPNIGDQRPLYAAGKVDLSGAAVKLPEESTVGYRDIDGDWVSPRANGHNACLDAILATMPKGE